MPVQINTSGHMPDIGHVYGNAGAIHSNQATLYIFPPDNHLPQIVRPYTYNFTPSLADKMASGDPFGQISNLKSAEDDVKQAVLPSYQGEIPDLRPLDAYFSFILIVDHKDQPASMLRSGGPKKRSIMIGYFIGCEPYTQSLGGIVLNPEALMVFTHVDMANLETQYGQGGAMDTPVSLGTADIVNQMVDSNYDPAMSLVDYSSISYAHNFDRFSNSMVRGANPITLSELDRGAAHVPETLKSPKNHLLGIAGAAQNAWGMTHDHQVVSDISAEVGGGNDVFQSAANVMMGSMQKEALEHSLTKIVDPTQPCHLSAITTKFPAMQVVPCNIENRPSFNLADPLAITPENIMSSMISNTVSAYCRSNMIASIQFRYNSWMMGRSEMERGKWEVQNLSSMILGDNNPNATLQKQFEQFRILMDNGLFPILKSQVGEFDLMVSFNGTGDTGICLNSLDNGVVRNEFVINHNRLGGWLSPTIGNYDALHTNQHNMTGLFNNVLDSVVGQSADHSPMEYYGFQGHPGGIEQEFGGGHDGLGGVMPSNQSAGGDVLIM